MGNGVSSSPREMEKGGVKACPFAGIIQIKFNGFSQIKSCRSNRRTPVMQLLKLTLSTNPPIQKINLYTVALTKSAVPSSPPHPSSRPVYVSIQGSRMANLHTDSRRRSRWAAAPSIMGFNLAVSRGAEVLQIVEPISI